MKPPSYLLALLFPKELFSFYHSTFLHIRTSRASDTTFIHLSTEETKKIVFDEKQRPSIGASRRGSFRPKKNNGHYANQIFKLKDGHLLQYNEYYVDGSSDLVVYLCNLAETKENTKARILRNYCMKTKKRLLAADWFARGGSTGRLMDATLTRWKNDTIEFLENAQPAGVVNKAVLVGCGVGAWVAVLVALDRPDLVRGFIGLSADPDFTEDLLWKNLPEQEKEAIMRDGFREVKWGGRSEVYPITSSLIVDGRENLVLRGGPSSLDIQCPVRLIHSLDDEEVPVSVPMKLADCLKAHDVEVIVPKLGGHRLEDVYTTPSWVDPMYGDQKFKPPELSPLEDALETSLEICFNSTSP